MKNELKALSLVLISSLTGEILEKWDFDVVCCHQGDVTVTGWVGYFVVMLILCCHVNNYVVMQCILVVMEYVAIENPQQPEKT